MSRCAECGTRSTRRVYYRIMRLAGGDYRRAARKVWTHVCSECAAEAVRYHAEARAERRNPGKWWGRARLDLQGIVSILIRRSRIDLSGRGTKMRKITSRAELLELKRELGVRASWHEPDEQDLTATVGGRTFDNAGFWPAEEIPSLPAETQEMYVVLHRSENRQGIIVPAEPIAAVNLATLFAWATGYEGEG